MCGIVGYIGSREVPAILIEGLKRLEYRGYDSCGIAVIDNGTPSVVRSAGRVQGLEDKIQGLWPPNSGVICGIGHTRWATHGRPTEGNAHPHSDCTGHFLVAHNGIIENYLELRQRLTAEGHVFRSDTDTEVLPHLIETHFRGSLENAVMTALREVDGVYSLVAVSTWDRMKIVAARKGAPLVIGVGRAESFIASDAPALLPHTRDLLFLDDGEVAVVRPDSTELRKLNGDSVSRPSEAISWSAEMAEKGGYPHFMLKEIFEQPRAIRETLCGRLQGDEAVTLESDLATPEAFAGVERLHIVACGTSLHAGLVGKFLIESLARIPVEVDYASEFRYRHPLLGARSMVVGISQSGETADTLGALREAGDRNAHRVTICNVVGSMAARQSESVLYTRAGPEIGVASTKAFTTQLVALNLLALWLAQARGALSTEEIRCRIRLLKQIPEQMERVLERNDEIVTLAERFCSHRNFLYLGRGVNYPIAMEGALKLKEISYIHAEGYPAGEMKHGPIALIDHQMPVVVLAPQDGVYRKTLANVEEVRVRGGQVLAVVTEGDREVSQLEVPAIPIPKTDELLYPLLAVLPLQLLAYHIAVLRSCDVDKPRNLAKSVTVE
jgi:glutamine---fructose-6-phosphate transaminase (isomerizing)